MYHSEPLCRAALPSAVRFLVEPFRDDLCGRRAMRRVSSALMVSAVKATI